MTIIVDEVKRQEAVAVQPGGGEVRDASLGARPQSLGTTTVITDDPSETTAAKVEHKQRLRVEIDPETGEEKRYLFCRMSSTWEPVYDAEAADLEQWLMLRYAQKILSRPQFFVVREKKSRHPYTDLTAKIKYCDLTTKKIVTVFAHEVGSPVVREKLYDIPGTVNKAAVFRTVNCYQSKIPGKDRKVELWQAPASSAGVKGRVNLHNVGVCGSPWTCPCCAPKINAGRRAEIVQAYEAAGRVGGCAYMLTFTIKHGIGDNLIDLGEKFKSAMQILQKTHAFKSVTRKSALVRAQTDSLPFLGYIGRIANLEVTHGKNGWHPHEHHLWFFRRDLTSVELVTIRNILFDAWSDSCFAVGLPRPLKTIKVKGKTQYLGLDIRRALSAAEYLTKYGAFNREGEAKNRRWGPEKELASSHSKQARAKGRTPFQLLYDYSQGDVQSGEKFLEFAQAFRGRHQLQFSRSLRAFLLEHAIEIDDSENGDLEIAARKDAQAVRLGSLTDNQFSKIVTNFSHGIVLSICRHNGFAAAVSYINSLSDDPRLEVF